VIVQLPSLGMDRSVQHEKKFQIIDVFNCYSKHSKDPFHSRSFLGVHFLDFFLIFLLSAKFENWHANNFSDIAGTFIKKSS
jgi:hypothetical protein